MFCANSGIVLLGITEIAEVAQDLLIFDSSVNGFINYVLSLLHYLEKLPRASEFVSHFGIVHVFESALQQFAYCSECRFGYRAAIESDLLSFAGLPGT